MNKTMTLPYVNEGKPFELFYDIERFIDEVLVNKEYESLLKRTDIFYKNNLKIIDLGCNIGTFSLYIYDKAREIYAIDMGRKNIEYLTQTIKRSNLSKIKPFCTAIAGSNRTIHMSYTPDNTDGGNTIYGDGEAMEAITLGRFVKENNIPYIDILKIDVEGAEEEIFKADDFPFPQVIVGEFHSNNDPHVLISKGYNYFQQGNLFVSEYVKN